MKRKNMFKLLGIGFLLTTVLLTGCGSNKKKDTEKTISSIEKIKDRGVLKVAVFGDKPPFGYIDKDSKNQGYDIYLAKRLAKKLLGDETKVEFVLTEAQNRVDVLKSNKVDIVLANFTVTDDRKKQVDFADPYMQVAIGVASPKSDLIKNVDELKDKTLLINKGTTAEIFFGKKYPSINQLKYDQNTEAFESLRNGRGAAIAHDNTLLYAWVKDNPDYEVGIKKLGSSDYIAPAVKKGNKELLEWTNKEIKNLKEEKFFNKAYDETLRDHFSSDIKAEDVIVEEK